MPTLYLDEQYLSPYTLTVFSALREKGISFEIKEVGFLRGEAKDPTFNLISPTGLIPTFKHDSFVLTESIAILEYIEEVATSAISIYPRPIELRARARQLMNWYRGGMQALRHERSTETIYYPELRAKAPLSREAQIEVDDLTRFLLDLLKDGRKFLFDGAWSVADTETTLMLHRLIANGDAIDPILVRYASRLWARPSIAEFVDRMRPAYVSYYS